MATIGYNMNAGLLRGMGDSRSPLIFLIVACMVNIVLDLLFVAVFRWDVMGVAIATVIAQFVSWIYSILHIKHNNPEMDFKLFRFSVDKTLLKNMVRLGLPLGFNNAIFSLGFLLLNGLVNQQGSIFMAGTTAASRVDNLIFLPITSFAAAATTFSGQNVGAGNHERLRKGFWQIMLLTQICNAVLSGVVLIFGELVLMIFNRDPEIIEVGLRCIWWIAPWYWIYDIFAICNNYMNGAGEVRMPTLASLFMFWGCRLPAAYLLFDALGRDYIYACYPISWLAGAAISSVYFFTGRWKRHYLSRAGGGALERTALTEKRPDNRETQVYFVRHAQADRSLGDADTHPLTPKGLADSRKVTAFFDGAHLDRIFSSPMRRAVDTLMDLAAKWGENIELEDGFRERRDGEHPADWDYAAFARHQWEDHTFALPGGESLAGVQAREMEALSDLLRRCAGQRIAVGCHGFALCALMQKFNPDFGYDDFMAVIDKTPWIVEMRFKGGVFTGMDTFEIE
jgi:broad specificity phosphatase PhoE